MVLKCNKCGRKLVPYITDPDVVEYLCPACDEFRLDISEISGCCDAMR